VTELTERLATLEKECGKYKDDYMRSLADFENYRRRIQREFETARHAAIESLVADLLPVLDNFDRALSISAGPSSDRFHEGVRLIRKQMTEALGRHGLEEFSCLGQEFDPRCAEAVSFVNSDKHDAHTVIEEQCKGYRCGGRVIRPAKVVVAKPGMSGGTRAAEEATDDEGSPDDEEQDVTSDKRTLE